MDDVEAEVRTARLVLRPPRPDDVAELFAMYAHPQVWEHDPVTRHTTVEQTAALVRRWQAAWERDGLGMWVARSAADAPLVGIGGCSVRQGVAWNLGYRLAPPFWGQGYAQEIVARALASARALHPGLPVTAYLVEGNERSRRATERAGLSLVWRGPDAGNPDPDAVRLLFADRPLSASLIATLTAD